MQIPIVRIIHRLNPQIIQQIEDGSMADKDVIELFNVYSKTHVENLPYFKKSRKWLYLFISTLFTGGLAVYILSVTTEYEFFDKVIQNNFRLQLILSYLVFGIALVSFLAFFVFAIAAIVTSIKAKPYSKNLTVYKDLLAAINKRDVNFFRENNLDISAVNFQI